MCVQRGVRFSTNRTKEYTVSLNQLSPNTNLALQAIIDKLPVKLANPVVSLAVYLAAIEVSGVDGSDGNPTAKVPNFVNYRQIRAHLEKLNLPANMIPALGAVAMYLALGTWVVTGIVPKAYANGGNADFALRRWLMQFGDNHVSPGHRLMLAAADVDFNEKLQQFVIDYAPITMDQSSYETTEDAARDLLAGLNGKRPPAVFKLTSGHPVGVNAGGMTERTLGDSLSSLANVLAAANADATKAGAATVRLPITGTGHGGVKLSFSPSVATPDDDQSLPSLPTTTQKATAMQADPATPALDISALNDPSKLGEFMSAAVKMVGEIPKLTQRANQLEHDLKKALANNDALVKDCNTLARDLVDAKEQLTDARAKASMARVSTPNQSGTGNDLDQLAKALHIDRAQLDGELAEFVKTCESPLVNPIRWPKWSDPDEMASSLPFTYRHNKPVFLAGPSGTGKTFVAEALSQHYAGRRCSITFHEKISYAKLFIRDTVEAGKVRGVLGPVLLAFLTGTPLILDEIDHADVFVQSLMHEALDKRRVFIPELAMSIRCEDQCRFIATGNSLTDDSGQYHGEVGTALRTRFAAIHVDYPSLEDETDTIHVASGCDKPVASMIGKAFAALRKAEAEQKLAGPISVRESCAVGKLVTQALADKFAVKPALAIAFKLMVVDKRPAGEQTVASEILDSVLGIKTSGFLSAIK
jgi:hypothetical protein